MERDEALILLRLGGVPAATEVEHAFQERQYEIEQKLITAAPEEGARVTLNFEMERLCEARDTLTVPPPVEPEAEPASDEATTAAPGPVTQAAETVNLSLPPVASPLQSGGGRLNAIGGWIVRVLALVAILAGIFVYLTQFGPLKGRWNEFTRDSDRAAYARSLRAGNDALTTRWTREAGFLHIEEPMEIAEARQAIERGDVLFAACRDERAITAWLEAKGRLEVGIGQLKVVREQHLAQGESTGEKIGHLFRELEKAEWGLERRERDANEEVQRAEENLKTVRSRDDRRQVEDELREAKARLGLARELHRANRRIVFECDRLPVIQSEVKQAVGGLKQADVFPAVEKLDALKVEIEELLTLSEEIDRTVRELWAVEQVLSAARARVETEERPLFAPANDTLAELHARLDAREFSEIRDGLPALRSSISGTERLLPLRSGARVQAERLGAARRFPELAAKLEAAAALHGVGDESLRAGKTAEAEKAYREATERTRALEGDLKLALFARAEEVAAEDLKAARAILEELLRLDPLDANALALKKKLSGQRETTGIIVPDTVKTLKAAMAAAKPGEVIRVRAGVHDGGFIFRDGVRIEGAGADRVTIRCGVADGNVILVKNCRAGSISGVTLEHVGTDEDDARFSCLHVENSTIQVRDVTMRNAAGNGVLVIRGGGTSVTGCRIEGSGWFGICFTDDGAGSATDNDCRRNGFSGIAVVSKARTIKVSANRCTNNGLHGVYFGAGTSGRAIGNTAEDNRGSGVAIRGTGARPVVSGNQCKNNRQFGIYLDGGAGGSVEGNTCTENDYSGIGAVGSAAGLSLVKNRCLGNRRDGIYLFDGARGTVEENHCEGNQDSGIAAIGTHASIVLRKNRCVNNRTWGIYFGGGGGGTAEKNVCERNTRDGLAVTEAGTTATVRDNRCVSNRGDGIHFARGTGGAAEGNTCAKNKGHGLYADPGCTARLAKTTAEGNGMGDLGGKARE